MMVLFLCRRSDVWKELWGYPRAFEKQGAQLVCVEDGIPKNANLQDLLKQLPERPSLIIQPESAFPLLPWGLTEVDIPTALFHCDTYLYVDQRIRWSMLFDYAVLFHPGFDERFRAGGHPGLITLSLAVPGELFEGPEEERVFEVGYVGRVDGPIYKTRRRVLDTLARHFRLNDWCPYHVPEQMARVYKQSKVVVNVARDDHPPDANLRVFESMAGGALLITRVPGELTSVGFEEGVHFIGYREEREIIGLVRQYLNDDVTRRRIAEAGREKVLREHTHDCRVKALLERVDKDADRLLAPARRWPEERVRQRYLEYYAASSCLDCAYSEFRQIAHRSLCGALAGASVIVRAWARQSKARVAAKVRWN